jgi:hypothetical protein
LLSFNRAHGASSQNAEYGYLRVMQEKYASR